MYLTRTTRWRADGDLVMSHKRYEWPNDAGLDFGAFTGWVAIATELRVNHDALIIETVYAYEHSGIAFKTGERTYPFSDQWDSGVAGLAYVTRRTWQETEGRPWTGSDADQARARELIAAEVEAYGQWANGECYGYVITNEYGEQVASCWGFIGRESVTEAAKEAAEGREHEVKCSSTLAGHPALLTTPGRAPCTVPRPERGHSLMRGTLNPVPRVMDYPSTTTKGTEPWNSS